MEPFGHTWLTEEQIIIADEFYERLKDRPMKVIERYHRYITPRSDSHFIRIYEDKEFRDETTAKSSACLRLFVENALKLSR